jgi:endoglucanase
VQSKLTTITRGASAATIPRAATCTDAWTPITASDYIAAINPGWNLGNTLDAVPDEGSWNNPAVVQATFDDVKNAGFKSVRIPGEARIKLS